MLPKAGENIMERKLMKPLSSISERKEKRKRGLLLIALGEDVLGAILLPGRKQARGRETGDLII